MGNTKGHYTWRKCALLDPNSTGAAIAKARYLQKDARGNVIETADEMLHRVASAVAGAEEQYGFFSQRGAAQLAGQFYQIMAAGEFIPSSPTLMNAGRGKGTQSSCFVIPIEDSIDGIGKGVQDAMRIQAAGGGTGASYSRLRPAGDRVSSTGGSACGPLPVIKLYGAAMAAIQQGGKRQGANMAVLHDWHPDIVDFCNLKRDPSTLCNFNSSVAVTDDFMTSLRATPSAPHHVRNPHTGETYCLKRDDGTSWSNASMFELFSRRAWESGEPGLLFIDKINAANPTGHVSAIESTNPCGEQPLPPYDSCNLASANLLSFVYVSDDETAFDFERLGEVVRLGVRFLDNVIDINCYPIPETRATTLGNRRIGLGLMGFADTLFALGIPYDSADGIAFGEKVMKVVNDESHLASSELAKERGCFPNWEGSTWERKGIPMRNATTTAIAPTGSISVLLNCSSGIEPVYALAYTRTLLDSQRVVAMNPVFEATAGVKGILSPFLMEAVNTRGSVQGMTEIPDAVRRVFVTAYDIAAEWHVRMQAAFQKHCDAGISKTINLRASASTDDVNRLFLLAYDMGCKGITVYRDGCRTGQPLALGTSTDSSRRDQAALQPATPINLPEIMTAIRVKQGTPFGNMHVKVVVDPISGRERELFAQLGKGGDLACADLEAICRVISLYLRLNGSIEEIVRQLDGIGTSLSVSTKDGRVASLADGLAKAVQKYLVAKKVAGLDALLLGKADLSDLGKGLRTLPSSGHRTPSPSSGYRVKCTCGADLVFEEGCVKCHGCGHAEC